MGRTLTIGDGIVDLIQTDDGTMEWHAGGAALNLAVGLSRLGQQSVLAGRIGADRHGFRIVRHLRDEGVRFINFPNVEPTGVAISERENGEPRYRFNAVMYRRRVVFTQDLLDAMAEADVVSVNTFPFQSFAQAEELYAARKRLDVPFVIDPNPRSRLISDCEAFRRGYELNMSGCFLTKLSTEDIDLLYAGDESIAVARLRSLGVERILLTRGSQGASFYLPGTGAVHVPSAVSAAEILDTMGAGDATLAAIIDWVVRRGAPREVEGWIPCVHRAMRIAGATCRKKGGGLVLDSEE